MTYNDLQIVKKYDGRRNQKGVYSKIFVQKGCRNIDDAFIARVDISEENYPLMLRHFDTYDLCAIGTYKSGSINGSTVYHVSCGIRGEGSLSEFFRIYAVEVDQAGAVKNINDEMYAVADIHMESSETIIKLRRGAQEIPHIRVDMMTGSFSYEGGRYHTILEIVGIGGHYGDNSYKLDVRNEGLIVDRDLIL